MPSPEIISKSNSGFRLRDYLATILTLEKEKTILSKAIYTMNEDIISQKNSISERPGASRLSNANIAKPDLMTPAVRLKKVLLSVLLAFIPVGIILLIWWVIKTVLGQDFINIALILSAASVLVCLICALAGKSNKAKIAQYNRLVGYQTQNKEKDNRQLAAYEERKKAALAVTNKLQSNLDAVRRQYKKTDAALSKLYSLNVVHPEYRSITAIASFYQYIDTGRCSKLKGHEGAYNLFEDEKFKGILILKLDELSNQMRQYQSVLFYALSEINNTIDKWGSHISNSINSQTQLMNKHYEIMEYNQRCTRDEIKALETYVIVRDLLDSSRR